MGNLIFGKKCNDLICMDIDQIDDKDISRGDGRILWLHGKRCNEKIFHFQSYSLRTYISMKSTYVRANLGAIGPPDEVIATFFPDQSYYEWFYKVSESNHECYNSIIDEDKSLKDSLLSMTEFLKKRNYKVLIGFSQGCLMIMHLCHYYQKNNLTIPFQKIVMICGVAPLNKNESIKLNIPSLHIQGTKDPFYQRSRALEDLYIAPIILTSFEGHNVPSKLNNIDIYEKIKDFCQN